MNIYESREEIKEHALEAAPNECCGLLIKKGQHQVVVRCRNESHTPQHNFRIASTEFRSAEDQGDILAVYHSHYGSPPVPTEADRTQSEVNKLPFLIYAHPADTWDVYTPCGWRAQLIGRPFVHGVLDCYTLAKDYYHDVCGIELDDFERPDDWWKPVKDCTGKVVKEPLNLYVENAEKQGFKRVNDLRIHDCLLMTLDGPVINHVAIYSEPGIILHHPPGHLSHKSPYVANWGYFAQSVVGIWRHKELF